MLRSEVTREYGGIQMEMSSMTSGGSFHYLLHPGAAGQEINLFIFTQLPFKAHKIHYIVQNHRSDSRKHRILKTTPKETIREKWRMTSAGPIFNSGLIHTWRSDEDLEYEISCRRRWVQCATWETGKPHAAGTTDNRELLVGIFSPSCSQGTLAPKTQAANGYRVAGAEWVITGLRYINRYQTNCSHFKCALWQIKLH